MHSYRAFQAAVLSAQQAMGGGPELLPSALATATEQTLSVDGASLSLQAGTLRLPLGASDDESAAAERAQCTIGEGPCLDAIQFGIVVHAPAARLHARWPVLADRWTSETPFRSALSVPVPTGSDVGCAINLYFVADHGGSTVVLRDAVQVAAATAERLQLAGAARSDAEGLAWFSTPSVTARQRVWIAVGIVMEASGLTSADALDRLRGHAFATMRTLDDLAAEVVAEVPQRPRWLS